MTRIHIQNSLMGRFYACSSSLVLLMYHSQHIQITFSITQDFATLYFRCKTEILSVKPDVATTEEGKVKQASPQGDAIGRLKNESIKMAPLPTASDSQGRTQMHCFA